MTASSDQPVLVVESLSVRYSRAALAVDNASLRVAAGEVVLILGPNGAGKTSLARGIAGALRSESLRRTGRVLFGGRNIVTQSPDQIARSGICLIPERNKVFAGLTVAENLDIFGKRRSAKSAEKAPPLDDALDLFPSIRGLLRRPAGLLSGGERQMLALCGAVLSRPLLLIVDEPSQGLAPIVVRQVLTALDEMRNQLDLGILVVDQNLRSTIRIADTSYLMNGGKLVKADLPSIERRIADGGYLEVFREEQGSTPIRGSS